MISDRGFPRLTDDNHRVTSPPSPRYNGFAWSTGDSDHWWQPGVFWPLAASAEDYGLDHLERAFASLGFIRSEDASIESGIEKVALYASPPFYTHAARQLPDGRWTSKLGRAEDIEHRTPEDVAGGIYGELTMILARPRPSASSASET